MWCMVVTLDGSKLSGWLNACAFCRVERRAYAMRTRFQNATRRPLPVPLAARRFPLALPTGRLLWERECATGAFSKRRMGFATLVERAAWCQPVKRGIYRTVFCQRSASYSRQRNKVLNSGSNQSAEMIMLQTPVSHAVSLTHPCGSAGGTPLSPVITARAVGDDIIS